MLPSGSWAAYIVFNKPNQRVFDPGTAVSLVEPFSRPLQCPSFLFDLRQLLANKVPRLDDDCAIFCNELFRKLRLPGADRARQDNDPQRIIVKVQMRSSVPVLCRGGGKS